MTTNEPDRQTLIWQRVENGLIALVILASVIAWGQAWWLLFALFYDLAHNYTAPAGLLATARGFHVAVNRALGYGLKLGACTHLSSIGKTSPASPAENIA